MSIRVAIRHRTEYHFDRLVSLAPHSVRLRPAPHSRTPILSYSLGIEPQTHFINWQQDPFGNYLARLVFPERSRSLVLDVELVAEMRVINPFDFFLEEEAETFPFPYGKALRNDLAPYLEVIENGAQLKDWLAKVPADEMRTIDFLVAINQRLCDDIEYTVRMEPGVQSCEETLTKRLGSCRDSAWLLVQILRHLGLAARFVSGYLVQLTADEKPVDGPAGPSADFTDLHAWTEVYLPGAGWVGLDPTSGLFAAEGHIPLACTPNPGAAAPIEGATDPCEVRFVFDNSVTRIHEDPRVTLPFDDGAWERIMALGEQVDTQLRDGEVKLTMGGEPTFVSIDDRDGEQWNTEALGKEKRELAETLLRRLRKHFAPQALLHYGQGKWYPGEPLPRWALTALWRKDDAPVWPADEKLLADPTATGSSTSGDALTFTQTLTEVLGIKPDTILPAYEDRLYYLWREGQLPHNVAVTENRVDDPLERERLARLLSGELGEIIGYCLPLARDESGKQWLSQIWKFRREHLYLVPGDSPMGLRLPLDSLEWAQPESRLKTHPPDPFSPRLPLPGFTSTVMLAQTLSEQSSDAGHDLPVGSVRTALCVQVRDGNLHLFLPPTDTAEEFLTLIHAIAATAQKLNLPVVLEGYEPPRDPRFVRLQVTPDPGVIEVNVQPTDNWRDLVALTETLYEEAKQTRLAAEKFMLDGRHCGTGGGNHVTMGAENAEDSLFLRRPGVLRSFITYWQHHPSLSYLFSGLFIGPTSQAPRVDEARDDNLYELEIAFERLGNALAAEGGEETAKPWLVDRALRNFLVDLTGNTHRSEFCIDKMYAPGTASGRLGILEFRGFEMPPHYRMSLVQMLLLRALTARFWNEDYHRPLIRWGTELHDRFMLPYYVWQDFTAVLSDLRSWGYAFEDEWFKPFYEFRFPRIGSFEIDGIAIELRNAIEPWHVLGEESGAQGTARYVDSSVERIQVSAHGLAPERFALTCNGRAVPLRATHTRGEMVSGVRFKAWDPYSALHPLIDAQVPLVFDLVDLVNERSLGGCTYHVAHPGGRNYETFPVNAMEAEARRSARFLEHGHTPGKVGITNAPAHPDHPYTLDLRR